MREERTDQAVAKTPAIRVMIVDDHDVVRKGLGVFLKTRPGFDLVGEARDGEHALLVCAQVNPDVVLMDLMMPRLNGVEATRQIKVRFPQVQVIALTSFQEHDLVTDALQAGAISYLLKDVSADELASAISSAHAGRSTLAPSVAQALVKATHQGTAIGSDLTPREREVLELVVDGLNNTEIAHRLVVSQATAKAHVSNILSKLGVTNRAEAIVAALQNKLVKIKDPIPRQ